MKISNQELSDLEFTYFVELCKDPKSLQHLIEKYNINVRDEVYKFLVETKDIVKPKFVETKFFIDPEDNSEEIFEDMYMLIDQINSDLKELENSKNS